MPETRRAGGRIRRLTSHEVTRYDVLSSELSRRVWVIRVPTLLGNYTGMSLGRFILLARDIPATGTSTLLAHELVHVRQWSELGAAGFLSRYLLDFARGLRSRRSWQGAYRDIRAEVEARKIASEWHRRWVDRPPFSAEPGSG